MRSALERIRASFFYDRPWIISLVPSQHKHGASVEKRAKCRHPCTHSECGCPADNMFARSVCL